MKLSDWQKRADKPFAANWIPALPLDRWFVAGLVAAAMLLRLVALGAESLWFDEAYSVAFASADLSLLNFLAPGGFAFTDKNVYHIVLHFWLGLGQSEFFIRLLSALFGIATVGVLFVVARKLFGWKPALWAVGLLAVSPFHVWYSREARMYVLAALLAWVAVWAVLRALSGASRWPWMGYLAASALGLYTHTFVVFLLLAVNLWAVLVFALEPEKRKAIVPWLAANFALVGLAVPWLLQISQQQGQGWWTWIADKYGTPGLKDLLRLPADFALGSVLPSWGWLGWIPVAAWSAGFVWGVIPPARDGERTWWTSGGSEWTCAIILAAVPALAAFVLAQFRAMFVLRYMVPFAPAFVLVAGRGFGRIRLQWARWGLVFPYLVGAGVALLTIYLTPQKEDWRGAAAYLTENAPSGAVIFLVDEDIRVPLLHYYEKPADLHPIWRGHTSDADLAPRIDPYAQTAGDFWLVVSHTDNDAVERYLLRYGTVAERREFLGVSILHFQRSGGVG